MFVTGRIVVSSVRYGDHRRPGHRVRDDRHVRGAQRDRRRRLPPHHHPAVRCRTDRSTAG